MEATDALNACFDCADWDVFFYAESSLVEVVDRVTSYVNFCIDVLVPVKEVKIHPNNKPWITRDIATLLMQRKQAFREGNMEETKNLRRKFRGQITENKMNFRNKVENSFKTNDSKTALEKPADVDRIQTCQEECGRQRYTGARQRVEHFLCFDHTDSSAEQEKALGNISRRTDQRTVTTTEEVRNRFRKTNSRSACGPDHIPGAVLRQCHSSLVSIFTRLFQLSLDTGYIPLLWETATVVPVPKKASSKALNDYRPVVLTSIPFKCMVRLILRRLLAATHPCQDPLQFAYRANRSLRMRS